MSERNLTIQRRGDHPWQIPFSGNANEVQVWYEEDFGPVEEKYRWDEEQGGFWLVSRKGLTREDWRRRMAENRARNERADRVRMARPATTGSLGKRANS